MVAVFWQLTLTYAVTQWRQIKQIEALACRSIFAIAFLCGASSSKHFLLAKNHGFTADVLFCCLILIPSLGCVGSCRASTKKVLPLKNKFD
jgi:hypothetical protein